MKRILEIGTPMSGEMGRFVEGLAHLDGFESLIIDENGGLDTVVVAKRLRKLCTKEIFIKVSCRDRNRIALRSQLATAASFGLLNVVIADGLHPVHSGFRAAKPVYEMDCVGLLRMMKRQGSQHGDGIDEFLCSQSWNIGVCVGGSTGADKIRANRFVDGGADIFFGGTAATVSMLKGLTDGPVVFRVPTVEADNLASAVRLAEEAGASAVSLVAADYERVLDGSIVGA